MSNGNEHGSTVAHEYGSIVVVGPPRRLVWFKGQYGRGNHAARIGDAGRTVTPITGEVGIAYTFVTRRQGKIDHEGSGTIPSEGAEITVTLQPVPLT
ncbi:hypothetical protein H0Z60_19610 [Ectothiorhodospiraceae bacterium WFHF3C12]|nr:hypothetical protein [Ectothiorhodospiraceae bacterium WFHF3C12]